jgi:hypothetical protein
LAAAFETRWREIWKKEEGTMEKEDGIDMWVPRLGYFGLYDDGKRDSDNDFE